MSFCEICFETFNKEEHKPMSLIPCAHTYCFECIEQLKEKAEYNCPSCRISISDVKPNYALINMLDLGFTQKSKNESITKSNNLLYEGKKTNLTLEMNKIKLTNDIAQNYFEEGMTSFKESKYNEAIELFNKAILSKPNYENAYLNKGRSYYRLCKLNLALECFDKCLSINSNYIPAYVYKGFSLQSMSKKDEAKKLFEKANELNTDPNDSENLYLKALTLDGLEQFDVAILFYDKMIEINPTDESFKSKGDSLWDSGKNEEAIECYDIAISMNRKNCSALFSKGLLLKNIKKFTEAQECFDSMLKINKKNLFAYKMKGKIFYELKNYENSIECYDKAIEIDSTYADFYNEKAWSLTYLNRTDEALECLDTSIELDKDLEDNFILKACILADSLLFKECIVCCDQGLKVNPTNATLYHLKGCSLVGLNKYKEAIEFLDKAIELKPDDEDFREEKRKALEKVPKKKFFFFKFNKN
jgi:tetratricopeptide (TPR) repeat protein